MLLELEKLRLRGIGRFLEEQVIYFDILGKLVQLGGQNNNTGGSSGAGKSTVFNALDYLLGLNKLPNSVLKSRLSDEGIWVEGTFRYGGKPLIITRGKKLCIDLDGEITTGSASKSEEKLDEILGMPRELFRKLLHKRQKEGGFFLQMTPRETSDFLTSALGHNLIKSKVEIVEKKGKELEDKKNALVSSLAASRSGLQATQDAILSMGLPPKREMHQQVVLELKLKAANSAASLAQVTSMFKLEEETLNASRPQITSAPFDRSQIECLERSQKEAQDLIRSSQDVEKDRINNAKTKAHKNQSAIKELRRSIALGEEAEKKAVEIAKQIKKIREGKCYTCGHDWLDSKTESGLISNIKLLREQIDAGKVALVALPTLEAIVAQDLDACTPKEVDVNHLMVSLQETAAKLMQERQKEKEHQFQETNRNRGLLDAFTAQETVQRARHKAALDHARGQADVDRRAFEGALGTLKAYEEAHARYESTHASLRAQEASYEQKISELVQTSDHVNNESQMAEELRRGLKSYLSCSFDEALESISENATKMIRFIPNMANATIQLQGTKETQDGKIKEEVTAVVHMDGEENVDIRSLCGGERTATDLAIDLSVIDLLESKANKGIDIFILDEPFDGLDTVCIEMALEVLKNSNSNKRLMIVDHNPEVRELVESKLTVVREGATSNIVQTS